MVVRPGPPRSEAWRALKPPIVPNAPVPGDVSVKYVHGPGGPSKASRSILVSRVTVTAAGVAVMESNIAAVGGGASEFTAPSHRGAWGRRDCESVRAELQPARRRWDRYRRGSRPVPALSGGIAYRTESCFINEPNRWEVPATPFPRESSTLPPPSRSVARPASIPGAPAPASFPHRAVAVPPGSPLADSPLIRARPESGNPPRPRCTHAKTPGPWSNAG